MALRPAWLAVVACAALLAGCAAAPALPEGLNRAEVDAIVDQANRDWWEQIAPGEPMPVVEPIEYLVSGGPTKGLDTCLTEANQTDQHDWEVAVFVCSMQYPYDMSDDDFGYLSAAELEYLWSYFATRLVPCLELMGYDIGTLPTKERFFAEPYLSWVPYYSMAPLPQTAREWKRIDARCPVPPVGSYWRPGAEHNDG